MDQQIKTFLEFMDEKFYIFNYLFVSQICGYFNNLLEFLNFKRLQKYPLPFEDEQFGFDIIVICVWWIREIMISWRFY